MKMICLHRLRILACLLLGYCGVANADMFDRLDMELRSAANCYALRPPESGWAPGGIIKRRGLFANGAPEPHTWPQDLFKANFDYRSLYQKSELVLDHRIIKVERNMEADFKLLRGLPIDVEAATTYASEFSVEFTEPYFVRLSEDSFLSSKNHMHLHKLKKRSVTGEKLFIPLKVLYVRSMTVRFKEQADFAGKLAAAEIESSLAVSPSRESSGPFALGFKFARSGASYLTFEIPKGRDALAIGYGDLLPISDSVIGKITSTATTPGSLEEDVVGNLEEIDQLEY